MQKHKWRFWMSVAAVWAVMVVTDWVFHGMWLMPWYQKTSQLWRPNQEMWQMMPFMWLGQAIFSWAFVWIYSKGVSKDNLWHQAFRYALAILLLAKVPHQLEMWATVPYPGALVARWLLISIVQAFGASFAMTWTMQPLAKAYAKAH